MEEFKQNDQQYQNPNPTSKAWLGVLLELFTGLIGLIIGLLLYKDGSYERKTFIKGWLITFFVCLGVGLLIGIIYYVSILASL